MSKPPVTIEQIEKQFVNALVLVIQRGSIKVDNPLTTAYCAASRARYGCSYGYDLDRVLDAILVAATKR